MFEPERDGRYHERGCPHFDIRAPSAESTHVDHFCDCHHFTEPAILRNGTDIAWPAGQTEEEVKEWRREHSLVKPGTPQDRSS
jgi:hypothetical protein